MESCIFANRCQFARYGLDNANFLQEHEFSLVNEGFISYRKFASVQTNIPMSCGESCPVWAVTEFLLRKNKLLNSNVTSKLTKPIIRICEKVVDEAMMRGDNFVTYVPKTFTCNEFADFLTYYGICVNWRGSAFSTVVYNLNFSAYYAEIQKRWNFKFSADDAFTEFDYITNIIQGKTEGKSNLLIVSGLDYVKFTDKPCEELFKIINHRQTNHLPLIIVTPNVTDIVGEGSFFGRLTSVLKEHEVSNA